MKTSTLSLYIAQKQWPIFATLQHLCDMNVAKKRVLDKNKPVVSMFVKPVIYKL